MKMLKRWQVLGKSAAAKAAIAVTIVLSLVALPLPGSMGWARGEAQAAPPAREATPPGQFNLSGLAGGVFSNATSTPPGQLKRRGLAGKVASLATSTVPTITILTIGSKFGDVQVLITDETRIHSPFYEDLSAEDLNGYRIAIHFAKGPANEDGTRTALRIMVIPGKAARTHSRGVIKAKKGGDDSGFEVVDEDGYVIDVDDDDLEEGDEVILVTQTVPDFEDDGDSRGHGRPKKIARGLQKASKIMKRLDRIMDRLTELGDSPKAEKLRARVEKFKAKHLERFNDLNVRFSGSGSDSDDGSQNRGRSKNQRGKDRPVDVGSTDFGPSDDGDDDGKQNRGRNRGRSADFSPQDSDDDEDKGNRGRGRGRNSGNRGGDN